MTSKFSDPEFAGYGPEVYQPLPDVPASL